MDAMEHVSAGEFERWMRHLDARLDKAAEAHENISGVAQKLDLRVAALENNQTAAGKLSAKLSAGVAIVITAVVSGVLHFLGGS